MSDLAEPNYSRLENAAIIFIRNHPGFERKAIYDGLPCFDPILIDIALFVLEEKRLIKGRYGDLGEESHLKRYYPIHIDRELS